MKKTKYTMWLFNAAVCLLCIVAGIVAFAESKIFIGVLDIILGIANGALAAHGYLINRD